MKAISIKGKAPEEIRTALVNGMSDGFRPTLAFVFMSIHADLESVCRLLDQQGIQIFGATTGGEFIDGDIGKGSIAILLMDMHPSHFKVMLQDYRNKEPVALVREMSVTAKGFFKNPSFIVSASFNATDESELLLTEPLINAIESVTGHDTIIWGGRAGDDFAFQDTVVFTNHLTTKRGILMLVLDGDNIQLRGEAASGLRPVGTEKIITKALGNWVYEIDHQPAAEMVLKYLGITLTQEEAETFFPREGIMFSVAREKGDSVIRGVGVFNWKEKSFSTLGVIREGEKIRLTLPPDFEVVEEVSRNAERIKQNEMPDADALLMFSCIGRLGQFGPLIGDEIEGVRKVFNAPMAGFFTYGEFGRTRDGDNEFHASTCCWVALKELHPLPET
jgi:hypothetical protein